MTHGVYLAPFTRSLVKAFHFPSPTIRVFGEVNGYSIMLCGFGGHSVGEADTLL